MKHKIELPVDDPKFIDNLCISYRHDFGLMDDEDKGLQYIRTMDFAITRYEQVINLTKALDERPI